MCDSRKLSLRLVLREPYMFWAEVILRAPGVEYRRQQETGDWGSWLCFSPDSVALGKSFSFGIKLDNLQVASSAKGLWVCKCWHVCYLNRSHYSKLVFLKELNVGVLPCVSVSLYKESIYRVATEPRRKWCKEGKKPFWIHCSSFTKFSIKDWLLSQMRSGIWKPCSLTGNDSWGRSPTNVLYCKLMGVTFSLL